MEKRDLNFIYPEHLVATDRKSISRVMLVENGDPVETTLSNILNQIDPDDVLIVNDTKVIPARIFSEDGLEVLFVEEIDENLWKVLCPVKRWPNNKKINLPRGVQLELIERGLPQIVKSSECLSHSYFFENGDMPLPPYIQKARGERKSRETDKSMYQTPWAEVVGSLAAPTASLHFTEGDIRKVKARGAKVRKLSLHIGLGTFLPIHSDNLNDHIMHAEKIVIPKETWLAVEECKALGGKIWALGSTVTRALESKAHEKLIECEDYFMGESDLFIRPPYQYQVVDCLMTNFHQPESTLIAMVMAFAGVNEVKSCYQWAMERNFRLFSYGDLSVWKR